MRSPERPPCPRTISQSQNGPNYNFHLGLIIIYDPPAPHYENHQKVNDIDARFQKEEITGNMKRK